MPMLSEDGAPSMPLWQAGAVPRKLLSALGMLRPTGLCRTTATCVGGAKAKSVGCWPSSAFVPSFLQPEDSTVQHANTPSDITVPLNRLPVIRYPSLRPGFPYGLLAGPSWSVKRQYPLISGGLSTTFVAV